VRRRPSARLLVLDGAGRLLLFRFAHDTGALAGQRFWATPGGGLGPGESYEDAARRELSEEVGLAIEHPGPQVARREVTLQLPDGEIVRADERYFLVRVRTAGVSDEGWTARERQVVSGHRWWTAEELRSTDERVWPDNLPDLLARAGTWPDAG
jgi:8-oxo-dGTP pyrophosphatase MutT (NUDIX family)